MKTWARMTALIGSAGLSALLFLVYYDQSFKRRDCFNALGRCFDSDTGVVYLEQTGQVWLMLALLSLFITLFQVWRLIR